MALQPGGQLGGVGAGPLQPQRERAEPPQRQPRLHRPRDGTAERAVAGQSLPQGLAPFARTGHGDTEDDVGVPGEVLGRGVDDDVRAVVEGALQQRRGEGVVHRHQRARLVPRPGERREVGDVQQGVGRGLQPQQVRALQRRGDLHLVGDVDPAGVHPSLRVGVGEGGDEPVVGRCRGDDDPADGHEREHRGDRGHPGGVEQAVAALELADRLLEGGPARVVDPRVVRRPVRDVGRGEGDRRVERRPGRALRPAQRHDLRPGREVRVGGPGVVFGHVSRLEASVRRR